MLFSRRNEIESYSKQQKLDFREDSSNRSLKYLRNHVRRQLIPLLHSIQPDFAGNITSTVFRIRDTESILKPYLEKVRKKLVRKRGDRWIISIPELSRLQPLSAWLYELLHPFDFNETTIRDLERSLGTESGKIFLSANYRIVKDRDILIINHLAKRSQGEIREKFLIKEGQATVRKPVRLRLKTIAKQSGRPISVSPDVATLDKNKLAFPLVIRKWKPGDYFYPFGLNKRKKLSDFFIDTKVPIPEKERTWVLCSGLKIAWIVGHRIDHRFRVTPYTKEILEIRFMDRVF